MRRSAVVILLLCLGFFFQRASATSQLIVNGGFESTSANPWVLGGTTGVQVVNGTQGSGIGPYDGAQFLTMGNALGAGQYAYQTVILPTNLIAATLSLAYDVASSDPNQDDYLTFYITTAGTPPFSPIYDFGAASSASPTGGWVFLSTNFITYPGGGTLSALAGMAVNVYFEASTDTSYVPLTSFGIDDVSLTVATTADIPGNDDFTNATLAPSSGITNAVITTYASREVGEPKIGNNVGGHSVWWTWTAPSLGNVVITTAGSDFITALGVFTGSSLGSLTAVTNNNGINRGSGLANLTFPVSPGTQYFIALDGYDGESGDAVFTLKFTKDTTPPIVRITSPVSGADVTNSSAPLKGTASDNVAVAVVEYQLLNANGSNALQAAEGTTAWSATVSNLVPGTNLVRVVAYDTSTNASKVASGLLNYIVPTPLSLTFIGEGTVLGATNGKLFNVGYPYTLTAKATPGFRFTGWTGDIFTNTAALRFVMRSNLSVTANFADVEKPMLSITEPTLHERWSNSVFTVTGKATDNVGVASVWLQVDGGPWTTGVNSNNRWTNWNASVTLNPGTNSIRAFAEDAAGNISLTNSVSFTYVVSATLTVETNGRGTIKPNYNNALLEVSNSYSMTATALSGYVFSNWTSAAGEVLATSPVLKFTMQSDLSFSANFVPNPFPAVAGTYQGLFYNSDDLSPVSSGFFTAQVTDSGSFTAKFQNGNLSPSVFGQFSLTGSWHTNALKTWGNTEIGLQLDLPGGKLISGGLTNTAWVALLNAYREVFSKNNPAPQAGKYTLILPGTNSEALPGGSGYGAVTVSSNGSVALNGALGDGTVVTPTANENENGLWPVYAPIYGDSGMLLGWLSFTNEADRDIDGVLNWYKPAQPKSALYKVGFTNEIEVIGSAYSFKSGERVLELTNGYMLLQDGGLPEPISNQFTLLPNNIVGGSNKTQLTLTPSSGLFKGSVTNGTAKPYSFSGAVLQKQTNGFGLFLNGEQSGGVVVGAQ